MPEHRGDDDHEGSRGGSAAGTPDPGSRSMMRQRAPWLVFVAVAVALWFVVCHGDRAAQDSARPDLTAVHRHPSARSRDEPVPDRSIEMASTPGGPSSGPGVPGQDRRPAENLATPPGPTDIARRPLAPGVAAPPPVLPAGADQGSSGKFTDRTGWGDDSVVKQLNKEFMPLASECIEQAQARDRRLRGMLAFTMVIAPTEGRKAVVASLKVRPDNQVDDPELFECIRESSFSLEGLRAPHDFDISMPIQPEGSGP